TGSYGIFATVDLAITWADECASSVYPSGVASATARAPMVPLAPGRCSKTMRGTTSAALPALNGTITRIGRVGHSSARPVLVEKRSVAITAARIGASCLRNPVLLGNAALLGGDYATLQG